MAGAWSCPHEAEGRCARVGGRVCEPGMKGCVLHGRYVIFDGDRAYAECAPVTEQGGAAQTGAKPGPERA